MNFADGQGMANSALEVVLGGFPFTAIGHQTRCRWVLVDGIPAVEAVWWAGGLRVTERISRWQAAKPSCGGSNLARSISLGRSKWLCGYRCRLESTQAGGVRWSLEPNGSAWRSTLSSRTPQGRPRKGHGGDRTVAHRAGRSITVEPCSRRIFRTVAARRRQRGSRPFRSCWNRPKTHGLPPRRSPPPTPPSATFSTTPGSACRA